MGFFNDVWDHVKAPFEASKEHIERQFETTIDVLKGDVSAWDGLVTCLKNSANHSIDFAFQSNYGAWTMGDKDLEFGGVTVNGSGAAVSDDTVHLTGVSHNRGRFIKSESDDHIILKLSDGSEKEIDGGKDKLRDGIKFDVDGDGDEDIIQLIKETYINENGEEKEREIINIEYL